MKRDEEREDEREAVPGTLAHQAHLRQLLDQESERFHEAAGGKLSREERDLVSQIVFGALQERSVRPLDLIETLEALLTDPEGGADAIYRSLQDFQSVMLHRIAQRAYQAGLESAKQAPQE